MSRHRKSSARGWPKPVELRDGATVLLRPIEPDDKQRLVDAFHRLSLESRYRRFFRVAPELSPAMVAYLTEVDHHDHEAIVAIDPERGDQLAVARYIRSRDDPASAEVAVTVVDDWQGRGLGKAVLEALVGRARKNGVRRFTAIAQANNPASIHLVQALGEHRSSHNGGYVELTVELPARSGLGSLCHLLREAARGSLVVMNRFQDAAAQFGRHGSETDEPGGRPLQPPTGPSAAGAGASQSLSPTAWRRGGASKR
jgi:GNAT superfamily N-acetyltransferase